MSEKGFSKYLHKARELGAMDAIIVPASSVITAEWVPMKCQFGCGGYGRRLCCPPETPTPERTAGMLRDYEHGLLIHVEGESIEKSNMNRLVFELEQAAFFDGFYKAFGMGAGPCNLCEKCADLCRHPVEARPSMESCGIDVFGTVRQFGLPIDVLKDRKEKLNFYGLVLIE